MNELDRYTDDYEEKTNQSEEQEENPALSVRKTPHRQKSRDRLLHFLLAQTVLCVLALLFCLAVKMFGGRLYEYSKAVFEKEFNTPIDVGQVLDSADAKSIVTAQNEKYGVGGETDDPTVPYIENYADAEAISENASEVNSMAMPVNGTVTSEFGYRIHPLSNKRSFHTGIDLGADSGDEIKAALDGIVTSREKNDADYGNYIVLTHADGVQTMYAHCSKLAVEKGNTVKKGSVIAYVGSTGKSTGPHLHFEVRVNDVRLDPRWYLDF